MNICELKLIDDDVDGETIEPKTEADVEEVQSPSSRDKRHIHIKQFNEQLLIKFFQSLVDDQPDSYEEPAVYDDQDDDKSPTAEELEDGEDETANDDFDETYEEEEDNADEEPDTNIYDEENAEEDDRYTYESQSDDDDDDGKVLLLTSVEKRHFSRT